MRGEVSKMKPGETGRNFPALPGPHPFPPGSVLGGKGSHYSPFAMLCKAEAQSGFRRAQWRPRYPTESWLWPAWGVGVSPSTVTQFPHPSQDSTAGHRPQC